MAMRSYTNLYSDPGDSFKKFDIIGVAEPKSFMNSKETKETNEKSCPTFRDEFNQSMRLSFIEYCHNTRFRHSLESKKRKMGPRKQYGERKWHFK